MKKISGTGVLSAFIVLMMLMGAFFVVATDTVSAAQDGDYTYTVGGGVATVTGYTGAGGAISIPSTLGGNNVVAIGDNAFVYCTVLTSVTIPALVTTIGTSAFAYCTSLTSATIGSGVTTIGSSAFNHCTVLTSVNIPGSVTTIGDYAFAGCIALTSIIIPNSVTSIGNGIFYFSTALTSVTIPASVITIGTYAFYSCTGLISINVDAANPNYASVDGVLYNKAKTTLLQYPGGKAGAFTTIPGTVTIISSSAFAYCIYITTVTIPSAVISIQDYAFWHCPGLTSINVDAANPNYASVDGVLYNKAMTTLLQYPGGKAGALTTIPGTVTTIESYAFYYCPALTSVTIPNSVITIGNNAVTYCAALTSVTIGSGVTNIGNMAFSYCANLTTISIPSSVTTIGSMVVYQCTGLTAINVAAANPNYANNASDGVLYDKAITTLIQYPIGKAGSFTIPASVATIGESAFESSTALTSVTIGIGVTTISSSAFYDCTALTSVTIPSGVTTIGSGAFSLCTNLTAINVAATNPKYANNAGDGVLYDKAITTLIKYPIGKAGAFTIPASVTIIGGAAFYSCTALTSVTIPGSVTIIGYSAFFDCTALTSVIIGNNVTTIDSYSFQLCDKLTSLTIPGSVTTIGTRAFALCTNLTSITFLGLVAPTSVGAEWVLMIPGAIRGYAYAASNFPVPGDVWNGLMMGAVLPIVPSAPNLSATPGNAQVALTWTIPASDGGSPITGYKLYRSATSSGSYALIASPSSLNYTNNGLTNGQIYWYKVSGVNANGEGNQSTPVSATPATVPTAPLSLQGTSGNAQVALTWQAPVSDGGSPITGYKLYRSSTSNGSYALIASPSSLNYTDAGLTNGETYSYKVSAVNANGEGAQCVVVSVLVPVPSPASDSTMLILVAIIAIVAVVAVVVFVMLKRKKGTPPMQGNVNGPAGNVQAPQGEQYQAPPQPAPPQEQLPAFCPECGAKTTGSQFCGSCGKKVK